MDKKDAACLVIGQTCLNRSRWYKSHKLLILRSTPYLYDESYFGYLIVVKSLLCYIIMYWSPMEGVLSIDKHMLDSR